MSTALPAGVSLVPILQADIRAIVSTAASHYFSTCITATDLYKDSIQCIVMGSVSSELASVKYWPI